MEPGMFNDLKWWPWILGVMFSLGLVGAFLLGKCS
jgi:hypothetical protein